MKDKETHNNVFDILDKMEFFQGQRAGRELWNDKPKEVQDKDISDFIKDINYIRSYLQDSVVLSKEEHEILVKTAQGKIGNMKATDFLKACISSGVMVEAVSTKEQVRQAVKEFAEELKAKTMCIQEYADGTRILETSNKLIDQSVKIFLTNY